MNAPDGSRWRNATRGEPCPVCGHATWCSARADGAFAVCRRVSAGGLAKKDRAGGDFYLHRLAGGPRAPAPSPAPPGRPPAAKADPDSLHAAYSALLARLPLSRAHRSQLLVRGLDDAAILRNEYRTMPASGRTAVARELLGRFGEPLFAVPGFVTREGERGPYPFLAGDAGLLVPVRDLAGRVVALKVRRDGPADGGPRYRSVSSAKYGGPSPGAPAHAPRGTPAAAGLVRVTEGELKADVVWHLGGGRVPTISIPGAANWSPALPMLGAMGAGTVRLAYDADAWEKPEVAGGLRRFAEAASSLGMEIELEVW